MIKAVVFDLDGTLLNTLPDIAHALNYSLEKHGLPTHPEEAYKYIVGGGIWQAVLRATPKDCPLEVQKSVLADYGPGYKAHCTERTAYYPGAQALLEGLEKRGIRYGILSNKTEATAQKVTRHYFPDNDFAFIQGRVENIPLKPDPAAAQRLLEILGCTPDEIAYSGDSGSDITFALNCGFLPLAAPWGFRSHEELLEAGAELMPESPLELLDMVLALA